MSVKTTIRRAVCILCLALVAGVMFALPAYATKGDPYTYTVRVFGGNEGTVSSAIAERTFNAGDEVRLSTGEVTLNDGTKYYVKGFRLSGQDDLHSQAFNISEDMDFVVAYGVAGEMVSYTISFVEYGTGNAVTVDSGVTSMTYYGKQGDKPVVPYEYAEGYRPRYQNITGTLGPEGTNNWTLEYIPIEEGEEATTTTPAATAAAPAAAAAAAAPAAAAAAPAAAAAAAPAADAAAADAAAAAAAPATEEIGDVDNPLASGTEGEGAEAASEESVGDDTNPAAAGEAAEESGSQGLPVGVIFGIAAAVVVAAGVVAALLRRKKDA